MVGKGTAALVCVRLKEKYCMSLASGSENGVSMLVGLVVNQPWSRQKPHLPPLVLEGHHVIFLTGQGHH